MNFKNTENGSFTKYTGFLMMNHVHSIPMWYKI
jgi:hypothetical protein